MTTTRISDRDAHELAHGRVPARPDLNELADLLTAYRAAAIGSAPQPSAALAARLDLASTPIAMQRDGVAAGVTSGRGARRAATGLFGMGLTVTIILGAASGAAAVVGAGSAGLLPQGAQDAFDQAVSVIVPPGVVGQETTDDGEAPGETAPDDTTRDGSGDDGISAPVEPVAPATSVPDDDSDDDGDHAEDDGDHAEGTSGSTSGSGESSSGHGKGSPKNNGNGNSENSNGNAATGHSDDTTESSTSGNGKSENGKSENGSKSGHGNSGNGNKGGNGKSEDDSED